MESIYLRLINRFGEAAPEVSGLDGGGKKAIKTLPPFTNVLARCNGVN